MNVLEPVFVSVFTADTYSCIKKRGIHAAAKAVRSALQDEAGTQYCLKLDIKKFYPTVDHAILKLLLRRKFKDQDLLWLLDEIIDSAPGLPIGNYLSQYLANFYLTYFDHWLKEEKQVRFYFRYADDMVILSGDKQYLHDLLAEIKHYLAVNLMLSVKSNYQVFPVAARSIDFVGYRFYHTHTLLRKSIKQRFARKMATGCNAQSIASYSGWAKHCNSRHLLKKLLTIKIPAGDIGNL
jgi:RNA-directed DNA polymerase